MTGETTKSEKISWPLATVFITAIIPIIVIAVFLGISEVENGRAKNQCRESNGMVIETPDPKGEGSNWYCKQGDDH